MRQTEKNDSDHQKTTRKRQQSVLKEAALRASDGPEAKRKRILGGTNAKGRGRSKKVLTPEHMDAIRGIKNQTMLHGKYAEMMDRHQKAKKSR